MAAEILKMKTCPLWIWFYLAKKISRGKLYRTNRHGAPDPKVQSFKFGKRITLPQIYWDGGVWAMPEDMISADDPGGGRSRLYAYLQKLGFGRQKTFFISRRYFPKGTGLNWRYEALRSIYVLSPDNARLVISLEEGKEYSESALKVAKHRERQAIEDILTRPAREAQGMTFEEFKLLREMYPTARKIRLPRELANYWNPKLVTFLTRGNLLEGVISVPSHPPSDVTFSEAIHPSLAPSSM